MISMNEERKYAILFAATLLWARKLIELDSDRPSPAKVAAVSTRLVRLWNAQTKWPDKGATNP
jgi:hypothetical protein